MTFFLILMKEIKQNMRDKQGLMLMMVFPLVLTLVLGFSLSGMFENDSSPTKIGALYQVETQDRFGSAFRSFAANSEEYNLVLIEETDAEKAHEAVRTGNTTCFILVSDKKITLYAREGTAFGISLVETILKGFTQTYDVAMVVRRDPGVSQTQFTESVSLAKGNKPSSMDYYAITMMTLIIMYCSMSGISAIADEKRDKTLTRIFCAPIRNAQILVPKVTGVVIATSLQILFVFIIDKLVLKANFGSNLLPVFAVLLAQIIMMVSVGVGAAYLFKNSTSGIAVIQSAIPLFVFLGGGYVNLELVGVTGFLEKLTYISPVKWINKTILQIVFANDYSTMGTTILICMTVSVLFLGLSAILSKKELKV